MDASLARGYASHYLRSRQDIMRVIDWERGPRGGDALRVMEQCARAKKPGRVLRRLAPVTRPVFHRTCVGAWTPQHKLVLAEAVAAGAETEVLDTRGRGAPLFRERALYMTNAFLHADRTEAQLCSITVSMISHHAIQRLLQRDMAAPQMLHHAAKDILARARTLGLMVEQFRSALPETAAFVLPYESGALAAVTMRVAPDPTTGRTEQRDVIAIRTCLAPHMLTPRHHARMAGFDKACDWLETDHAAVRDWLVHNAVPWELGTGDTVA